MVSNSVQFRQFLVCCSATRSGHRAQPFVKVGARALVPYGVGLTASAAFASTFDEKSTPAGRY